MGEALARLQDRSVEHALRRLPAAVPADDDALGIDHGRLPEPKLTHGVGDGLDGGLVLAGVAPVGGNLINRPLLNLDFPVPPACSPGSFNPAKDIARFAVPPSPHGREVDTEAIDCRIVFRGPDEAARSREGSR